MKNALISSLLIFFCYCSSQKKNSEVDKYIVSIHNEKCFDKVEIENKISKKKHTITWNNNDCDATIRSYIDKIDYKNDTITLNIWMENIDKMYIQIIANSEQPYINKLYRKTHYFEKDYECKYFINQKISTGMNIELSGFINNWIEENKCN